MINVATDCSGIEAPIEALKQMRKKFKHVWACDIDKYCRESIKANYKPIYLYTDIFNRTLPDEPIDLYVCGFPCQSYSLIGKKMGSRDVRSNVKGECVNTIKMTKPKVFLLENVKNFKTIEGGVIFNNLIESLNNDDDYNIYTEILNTKDYGIPQNRIRLFIVGIRKDCEIKKFSFPKQKKMKELSTLLKEFHVADTVISPSLQKNLNKINNETGYIVTPFTFYSAMKGLSPTLTTNCNNFFSTTHNRYLTTEECLLLQGFTSKFKQVVSKTQMYKQIGNSMSVNVIKCIFKEIFKSCKF